MIELVKAFGFSFPIDPNCDDIGSTYPYLDIAVQQKKDADAKAPT